MSRRPISRPRTNLIRGPFIAVALSFSGLAVASCGGEVPVNEPIDTVSAELLNACGTPGITSTLLAQPTGDLCAPHFGATDYAKRECVFDKNDAGDSLDGD